jgi:L-serine dehydratase
MVISVFDLFAVGIGPSSSHTVGPMRAAQRFGCRLRENRLLERVHRVKAELFGSLGATGYGHGSPSAVLLGLQGDHPETVDPMAGAKRVDEVERTGRLLLAGAREVAFSTSRDLVLHRRKSLPVHPNGLRFIAFDAVGTELDSAIYYSVGGGFVVDDNAAGADRVQPDRTEVPLPFHTGAELLRRTEESGRSISGVMLANETSWRDEHAVWEGLVEIWRVMRECVANGCCNTGDLPGGLRVRRRAAELSAALTDQDDSMEWVRPCARPGGT